jgi:pilus assembly protein CpaB
MTRRRRALLLAGLALLLGGLAASDVASREAALAERIGPAIPVVVAREAIPAGTALEARRLAVRQVPARFAPRGAFAAPEALAGLEATVPIPAGSEIVAGMAGADGGRLAGGAPVRHGERVAEVVAAGSPELVRPGGRVDVLVTREPRPGRAGGTVLALEDVEVLAAAPAPAAGGDAEAGGRVAASLRVTLRQAVFLAAAGSFAREVRLLPRAAGDRARGRTGLRIDTTELGA